MLIGTVDQGNIVNVQFTAKVLHLASVYIGAIQVLRNAMRGGGYPLSRKKRYEGLTPSTLLALRGGGWESKSLEKALRNTWMAP